MDIGRPREEPRAAGDRRAGHQPGAAGQAFVFDLVHGQRRRETAVLAEPVDAHPFVGDAHFGTDPEAVDRVIQSQGCARAEQFGFGLRTLNANGGAQRQDADDVDIAFAIGHVRHGVERADSAPGKAVHGPGFVIHVGQIAIAVDIASAVGIAGGDAEAGGGRDIVGQAQHRACRFLFQPAHRLVVQIEAAVAEQADPAIGVEAVALDPFELGALRSDDALARTGDRARKGETGKQAGDRLALDFLSDACRMGTVCHQVGAVGVRRHVIFRPAAERGSHARHPGHVGDSELCRVGDDLVEQLRGVEEQDVGTVGGQRVLVGRVEEIDGGAVRLDRHRNDAIGPQLFQTIDGVGQRRGGIGQDGGIGSAAPDEGEEVVTAALDVNDIAVFERTPGGHVILDLRGDGDRDAAGFLHPGAADGEVQAALAIGGLQLVPQQRREHFGRNRIGIGGEAAFARRQRQDLREEAAVRQAVAEHDDARLRIVVGILRHRQGRGGGAGQCGRQRGEGYQGFHSALPNLDPEIVSP